jgi:hypothetical protein
MSVRTRRAATPTCVAVEGGSIIGFKDGQAGVKQLAFGHDDDIEALSDLVTAKNLSNESLSPVAHDRAAELSCRRDTQPPDRTFVWQDEHGAVAAVDPGPSLIHLLKLCSPAYPFGRTKSGHGPVRAGAIRSKPSVVCGLLHAGASGPDDRSWWTSGPETHESVCDDAYSVGTCACLSWPPFV